MNNSTKLLPVGFYDLIFDEAEKNHKNINLALDVFLSSNYRLIKAPLVEFASNFSENNLQNSFFTSDAISGKNLVFRNDITLQIARLLETRLENFSEKPLRICYAGDVLQARNNELYPSRQQTQVGLEIIGCESEESIFEIVNNLLLALQKLLSEKILIEFSLPDFLEVFLNEINAANSAQLKAAILKKDISLIRKLDAKNSEILTQIILKNDDFDYLKEIIFNFSNSEKIRKELELLGKIKNFFAAKNIALAFDLFGDEKSSYHNQISFDVFCENFPYPIARGGKYKIANLDSVGSTIYMSNILLKMR
jgi:ATP phosphoribosyltransferase regulatory subunit